MHHFSWFHLIPSIADGSAFPFLAEGIRENGDAYVIPAAWLVCGFIIVLALIARMRLEKARAAGGVQALVPEAGLGPRNLLEIYTESIFGLAENVLGRRDARTYFPLLGTLFIYILVSNLMGLLPGFLPPTGQLVNNAAMAVTVFLVFNWSGLRRNGLAYLKHMGGPILVMWLPMFLLETISLLVRPVSLTLRLTGNMFGDHTVFGMMSGLVEYPFAYPAIFLGLGAFVSFIQALIFTLLTTVYIALAVAPMEEHH